MHFKPLIFRNRFMQKSIFNILRIKKLKELNNFEYEIY